MRSGFQRREVVARLQAGARRRHPGLQCCGDQSMVRAPVQTKPGSQGRAAARGIPFFTVGACACDLLLDLHYGFGVRRATNDVDFGVLVGSWDEIEGYLTCSGEEFWFSPHGLDPQTSGVRGASESRLTACRLRSSCGFKYCRVVSMSLCPSRCWRVTMSQPFSSSRVA